MGAGKDSTENWREGRDYLWRACQTPQGVAGAALGVHAQPPGQGQRSGFFPSDSQMKSARRGKSILQNVLRALARRPCR